jgi:4-hydroxybenzoate polyprenyltransferase
MSRQKVIDLLAMSRFANLPTVWSNGFLGVLMGWGLFKDQAHVCPICLTLIGLSLSFLYLGGCFFNDWHDVAFDQKTRPERPIPSGRWERKTILTFALALMGGGLLLAAFVSLPAGLFAAGIIICIVAYTKWHKVHPASFFFMAGARSLIYPLAAFSLLSWEQFTSVNPTSLPVFILLALGLGGYILGISLTARAETSRNPVSDVQMTFPILCLCSPILFFSGPLLLQSPAPALIPLALFILILAIIVRRLRATHDVGQFVSRTLAAIPLVDFLVVFFIAPHFIFWIIVPALALMALGLQKIAPAT